MYNDIPRVEPYVTRGSVTFGCTLPLENGRYTIRSGWAYNWPWPLDAYNHLLSNSKNIEKVGTLTVGPVPTEEVISPFPFILLGAPVAVFLALGSKG